MAAQWTISDAWVLACIEGTGPDDGCAIVQIIVRADVINHALLTEAEFTQAVSRLAAAGLIGAHADVDRYWLTETGHALRQRCGKGGVVNWMSLIPAALRQCGEPRDATWSLPGGVFDRAVRQYQ